MVTAEAEATDSTNSQSTDAPRRRGGRPPCAPEDRRVHYLTVGFTERQLADVHGYAQALGLSMATCVRLAALERIKLDA